MKEEMCKLFPTLMVSLSLGLGPLARNEIRKLLEVFSRTGNAQVQVLDEVGREKELEEARRRKFPNFFRGARNS